MMTSPWLWATLFLLCVSALVYCLVKLRTYQKMAPPKPVDENKIIADFLELQFEKTKRLMDDDYCGAEDLDKKAISLRCAYLKVEEKCLANNSDIKEYHKTLNKNLAKLLRIIKDECRREGSVAGNFSDDDTQERENKELLDSIHEFASSSCADTAGARKAKFNSLYNSVQKVKNPAERRQMEEALMGVEPPDARHGLSSAFMALDTCAAEIGEIKNKMAHPQGFSEDLRSRLEQLERKNIKLHSQVEMLRQLVKDSGKQAHSEVRHSILGQGFSDDIIARYEIEIQTLKDLVHSQRIALADLEYELKVANGGYKHAAADYASQDDAEAALLRELQGDRLVPTAKHPNSSAQIVVDGEALDILNSTIEHLNKDIFQLKEINELWRMECDFVRELLSVESLEDLALFLVQYFCDRQCDPFLSIKSRGRAIEISSIGALSLKDKTLINNMALNYVSRDDDLSQLQFHFRYIGGILRFLPGVIDNDFDFESLLAAAKAADKFVEKISSNQQARNLKKQLNLGLNDTKQLAQIVDSSYEQLVQAHRQSVAAHMAKTQDQLRSQKTPPSILTRLGQTETEILNELSVSNSVRVKIRKEFLALVKKLDLDH